MTQEFLTGFLGLPSPRGRNGPLHALNCASTVHLETQGKSLHNRPYPSWNGISANAIITLALHFHQR